MKRSPRGGLFLFEPGLLWTYASELLRTRSGFVQGLPGFCRCFAGTKSDSCPSHLRVISKSDLVKTRINLVYLAILVEVSHGEDTGKSRVQPGETSKNDDSQGIQNLGGWRPCS